MKLGVSFPSWPGVLPCPSGCAEMKRDVSFPSWPGVSRPPTHRRMYNASGNPPTGGGLPGHVWTRLAMTEKTCSGSSKASQDSPVQIPPLRIVCRDQIVLPFPRPSLDVGLPLDCCADVVEAFEVDQSFQVVLPGKSTERPCPMFGNPPYQIIRDPNIERAMRMVRHEVDPTAFHRDQTIRGSKAGAWMAGTRPAMTETPALPMPLNRPVPPEVPPLPIRPMLRRLLPQSCHAVKAAPPVVPYREGCSPRSGHVVKAAWPEQSHAAKGGAARIPYIESHPESDGRGMDGSLPVGPSYNIKLSGSSTIALNAFSQLAPSAPSTTR